MGLPLVATNDLHYVRRAQAEAHDVLLCVGTGSNLDTPNRMRFETEEFYLKSAAEMASLFPDVPEAMRQHAPGRGDGRPAASTSASCACRISRSPTGTRSKSWLRKECERGLRAPLRHVVTRKICSAGSTTSWT